MPTKPGILNKCEATIIHLSLCWPRYCASQVCNKGARWEDTSCSLPLLLSTFPSCCSISQVCNKGTQWEDTGCSLPLLYYLPLLLFQQPGVQQGCSVGRHLLCLATTVIYLPLLLFQQPGVSQGCSVVRHWLFLTTTV